MTSSQMLREVPARRQLSSPLAQVCEPQNSIDKIIVCRQLQSVDAGLTERGPEFLLASLGYRRKALSESSIVGVDEQLFAGLGVPHHEQAQVRQFHLQRIIEPHRHDLMALCEVGQRLSPTRHTDERRADKNKRATLHEARR